MNRGSVYRITVEGKKRLASMRPRFMNRGSPSEYNDGAIAMVASMRPRFMNRGSAVLSVPAVLSKRLQ